MASHSPELVVRSIAPERAAAIWYPALDEVCARTAAMWTAARLDRRTLNARWEELCEFAAVYAQLDYDRAYQTAVLVAPAHLLDLIGSLR